ncbi:hypothetical protein [Nocardioides sp. W7]|uniref:hypothetical protein n=1 Tax=Nocardioides sp. W7 TaxID=2931390 RepID=UPI001FD30F46|nr:hypothetical protein [Nocardioides sp. W7]
MVRTEVDRLNRIVDVAAAHACRAMLELQDHRRSPDPQMRAAYEAVHDLIGDLGGLRMAITVLVEPH